MPQVAAVAPAAARVARPIAVSDLTGVWVAAGSDRPAFSGTVEIASARGGWNARAATARAAGYPVGGDVAFRFPGAVGALRLRLPASPQMRAMWIQSGSPIDSNAYATPVALRASGRDAWMGVVSPFVPRYELEIAFVTKADGSLGGFMRDPIGNFGTMAPFDRVTLDGTGIVIRTRAHVFRGSMDETAGVLQLGIGTGPPMNFHRLNPTVANGFFPLPAGADASFALPPDEGDGWKVESPRGAGIDDERLQRLAIYLSSQAPRSPASPYIQSLLVARDARLVAEHYYFGFNRGRPHDVRSAGKSLDAALFGVAMRHTPGLTVDAPAYRWLPYRALAHPDKRKMQITIGDFFDMTSGLDCDDNNDDSLGNEERMQSQTAQPDWYRYVMDLPMRRDPGAPKAAYCSGGLNMIGAFIIAATHRWTPQFFDRAIAQPLQFGEYHLQLTPTGEMYLGGGSYFLPRDFLKLGELFLDGGVWNGYRLLAKAWVRDAVSPHSGLNQPDDYGYGWHLTHYHASGVTYGAYEAQGNGGQFVVVVPRLRLVVGIMAANYGNFRTWGRFHDLIERYIVAACR